MNVKKVISYFLVASLFSFLLWNIAKGGNEVVGYLASFDYKKALMVFPFLVLIYPVNVLSWHLITRAVGARIPFYKNFRIWMLSNLARFVPGGFWQYPGRVYLFSKEGQTKAAGTTAVVFEALLNVFVGGLIVLATTFSGKLLMAEKPTVAYFLVVVFLLILILFLSNKKALSFLINLLARLSKKGEVVREIQFSGTWIIPTCIVIFVQFFFAGTILFFLSASFIELPLSLLPVFIGIFTFSWLAGYLTLIAPAGLGVQEASIASLMSLYIPFSLASVLAILFRLLILSSEALMLILAFFLFGRKDLTKES